MSIYRGSGGSGDATNDATVTAVQTAATQAAASATSAANSATAAATSASGAATSATNAANSATTASGYATTAAGHASSASTYATNSSLSADDSADYALESQTYASQAFDSATAAALSASDALDSEVAAGVSATSASASAASALAIYGNTTAMNAAIASATASASSASTSASTATTQASNAASSASTATTQAAAALVSANNADADATSASIDANEAQAAAIAAQAAVNNAEAIYGSLADIQEADANVTANRDAAAASATSASNSASTATTQAGIATTQANAAAASAAAASAVVLSNEPVRPIVRPSLLLDFANAKQLDPRVTFSRPTVASYYDEKTTVVAEQNLLTYSQQLATAPWTVQGGGVLTATNNATTAPDGTTTATSLIPTTTSSNVHRLNYGTTTGYFTAGLSYTFSVYLKATGYTGVILANDSPAMNIYVDLAGLTASGDATITSVGNSWYRVTCPSFVAGSAINLRIAVFNNITNANSQTAYAGDGTSGIYAWGAQLEQRSSVTAYTPTTTTAITNYIPVLLTQQSNEARFDHNPTTRESLGLLIEEQRTNLLTYSSDYTNALWVKGNATITTTANIAPDGTQTMQQLVENTATTVAHSISYLYTTTAQAYTFSCYVKANGRSIIALAGPWAFAGAWFNLSTATVGTTQAGITSASITPVGNGVFRCSITGTAVAASSYAYVYTAQTDGSVTYTGNGFSGIYIWGAQLEAGAFATSYIPTVASQVTRSADSASMTGANFSSWYNNAEGTIYSETSAYALNGSNWAISDGTTANRILSGFDATYNLFVASSGTTQAQITVGAFTANTYGKVAGTYKTNDFAVSLNASSVGTDTVGVVPTVNQLQIGGGASNASGSILNGRIKKFAYYPIRVTNAQLQGLTTV